MPYDPRTGRMITDEQAERLAEEAGRPAPPPRPEEEPGWTERLGDAAFKGISTALRFTQKVQGVLSGQEALSLRPIEQFTGWDAPDIMELGTRINLGMTPLAWPKEFKSPIMEAIGLPVRPVAAVVSPTLEYLRRIRMGEETDSLKWGQEFARGLFYAPQSDDPVSKIATPFGEWTGAGALLKQFKPEWLEPPESDRFRAGYELLTGQREGEARGWTGAAGLLAGEAGELLPMLPLLLISRGPASTRGMQRVGARAATRTGRYLFESARRAANSGADVSVVEGMVKASREAPGVFRSLSDRWYGQRRSLAGNIRSSMREGRGTALDRALRDFVEGDARLLREAQDALMARGVPEQAARAAARGFANEIIWGAEDGWRLAGVRLGRRPGTSVASRLRSGAQTTAGRSAAEMRGVSEHTGIADVTGARSTLTRTMEEMGLREQNPVWAEAEPVRSQAVINAEYYLKPRSVRATEASETARSSVLETMDAGAQSAAKVRAEAVLRENLSGAVKRLRMNEEAQADLMGRAPAAEAAPAEVPAEAPVEAPVAAAAAPSLFEPMASPQAEPAAPAQQEAPGASASVVEGTSLPPAPEEAPRGAQAAQPTPEQAEAPATETQLLHMTQEEFAARPPEGYTWRPGKRNEASRKTDESGQPYTELGPKFFELDPDVRADILEHEGGHDLDTLWLDAGIDALGWQLLEQNALDDMVNKPNYPEGERIPGETWHLYGGNRTPGEAIADAYRDYLRRPEAFRERATPQLQEAMASYFAEAQQKAPAALPQPGERVVMREARTGREEVGQVVADPETGEPLVAAAADGTPIVSFEREDGTTTWVPWVADESIVTFEQAPQEAPAPVEAPSASEVLNIPPPPPVLADDAARAAVNRNIRALNAALDHVLPQLARMVETHDPASATAVAATQAIRVATTARNEAQAATDAPTDALAEIVAQVSGASDARARTAAEDAVAEVMVVAQVLSEQLQAALVEQGVPVPEAQAAGRRASAGYLLLHEATLREGDRWTDAMEGLAAVQEGMTPQTLEDLQGREALKQAALREAFRTLGEEAALPELEQFTLEAPGPEATSREQAHAMLDDGEVLPGEPPIVTVAREAVEQVGGEFTPDMAEIAREAELERLKVEASRLQREIEGYTEGYASYNDNLQAEFDRQLSQHMESERRSKAEADSKQDTEQIVEAARSLKPYVLKYPDVRTELKPTLAVLETETLGMLTAIHHRLLGIYERPRGQAALSREERAILTWLSAATQKGASARDQLRIVLGEAVAEAVIEQGAIKPDGTLDFDKLPRTERRIFEAHAERREFYDDIREGRKGLPSFKQLSERLYDYRHYGDTGEPSPRPEAIEDYLPQFTIHAQGPEDLEWLRDVFTLEWMTAKQQPQVRNRYERLGLLENKQEGLREPRREDIVRKRHYPTIYDKMGDMVEIAEKYGVDPGTVEVDTLIQDTVYLHQFGALRTAVGVYEWIHEYGDKAMDVQMDPALGPEVAQQMMNEGWGAPRPFGLELPGTEGFLLPPPVQGALNGIIAKGTLTPIIDQVILRKIMPPVKKLFWSMSMVPLQTITFLGTQFVELFSNVFASGAANPLRWKSLFEGYALANRVLARQIMGIAESCPPTTWAAEMKLAHARTQENLWAALMKRYKLTPDDIQTLQDIVKRHNIVEGSVGAQAHEHLERMLGTLNLHAKEIQAISHGIMSMVFGIDTFARTWSICSLVAQGYTGDEAGKMTRESSANYDLKTPIYGLLSSWAFYSTWLMQRAEQAASLTYKRPGVLYLFAQLEEDKERLLGFSAGWQPLVEAGLWWAVDDPTVMPLKSGHPLRAEIDQFLAGTEFLEEEDGYQMFYAPFRLPLLDIIGTGRSFVNRPGETLMEMAVPAVRGLAEVESGSGKASSLLREMPGVGPWARAADRFPEEVMPRLTASVGPMQLALADPPEEFWAGVVDAGETPRAAQATPAQWKKAKRQVEMGVPRSQTDAGRYEVEKMQFLYLLEKAKRRTGVPIYAGGVPEAVNLLTPEGIERVIEAIDAGEWIVSKPSETPQQFRKRLEEELGQRRPEEAGKAPVGPMTPEEQRGGIAQSVSRMLRPVTMEGVTP